jgi:glycopeptide antibiotics resistance protein
LIADLETKYVWTCVCGAALGVIGIRYTIRRNRRSAI